MGAVEGEMNPRGVVLKVSLAYAPSVTAVLTPIASRISGSRPRRPFGNRSLHTGLITFHEIGTFTGFLFRGRPPKNPAVRSRCGSLLIIVYPTGLLREVALRDHAERTPERLPRPLPASLDEQSTRDHDPPTFAISTSRT